MNALDILLSRALTRRYWLTVAGGGFIGGFVSGFVVDLIREGVCR